MAVNHYVVKDGVVQGDRKSDPPMSKEDRKPCSKCGKEVLYLTDGRYGPKDQCYSCWKKWYQVEHPDDPLELIKKGSGQ